MDLSSLHAKYIFLRWTKKNLRRLFVVERIFLSDKKSQILNGINCWLFKEERKIPWLISGTGSVSSFLNAEVRLVEGGGASGAGARGCFLWRNCHQKSRPICPCWQTRNLSFYILLFVLILVFQRPNAPPFEFSLGAVWRKDIKARKHVWSVSGQKEPMAGDSKRPPVYPVRVINDAPVKMSWQLCWLFWTESFLKFKILSFTCKHKELIVTVGIA